MKRPKKLFRYVHEYVDKSGNPRAYLRRPGHPRVALPWPVGSKEFQTAYHAAMNGEAVSKEGAGASKSLSGTISALVAKYYMSAEFKNLATATHRNYTSIIEPFRIEHGDKPVAALKREHINSILDKRATTSPAQAKNLRKRLSTLMQFAVDFGFRTDNPMSMVKRIKHKAKGYETWTEEDIAKYRSHWPDGTPQRTAFEILLYTGLRRADVVRLGRQHIQSGRIVFKTKKSGETVELNIPIHNEFRKLIASITHGHLNFIVTGQGAARSEKAFTNWIIEAATKAQLPPHRSPHGLRKASFRRLAEAGCSASEIMSITGHKNLAEVELYVRAADQKKMANAAMNKTYGAT